MKYTFEIADKEIFAVQNILYSKTDLEMWYDWNERKCDTLGRESQIWIKADNKKIGGFCIQNDSVMYPFLIPPFDDRIEFWHIIEKYRKEERPDIISANGIIDEDVKILKSFGYQIENGRQIMCCPTEPINYIIPNGFSLRMIRSENELIELSQTIFDCYSNGINNKYMGERTIDEINTNSKFLFKIFRKNNFSVKIIETATKKTVGVCIGGVNDEIPLKFAEIADICVVNDHRGKAIGECMINYIISKSYQISPVVKLCVIDGSNAESLYRKLGFTGGQTFYKLTLHKSLY